MATKLFKSLTIGGDTYKLADELGKVTPSKTLKAITTANTDIIGATQTITEAGTYLAIAHWTFPSASTTGNRISSVCVGMKSNSASTYSFFNRQYEGSPGNNYIHIFAPWVFSVDTDLPVTIASVGRSSATSSAQDYSTLIVCKLINTFYE